MTFMTFKAKSLTLQLVLMSRAKVTQRPNVMTFNRPTVTCPETCNNNSKVYIARLINNSLTTRSNYRANDPHKHCPQ